MPRTKTSWKPRESGNPAGRPKGSRDQITKAFLDDIAADWQAHGAEALQRAREERPVEYCRLVDGLVLGVGEVNTEEGAEDGRRA
jgi:hypothetical protein